MADSVDIKECTVKIVRLEAVVTVEIVLRGMVEKVHVSWSGKGRLREK